MVVSFLIDAAENNVIWMRARHIWDSLVHVDILKWQRRAHVGGTIALARWFWHLGEYICYGFYWAGVRFEDTRVLDRCGGTKKLDQILNNDTSIVPMATPTTASRTTFFWWKKRHRDVWMWTHHSQNRSLSHRSTLLSDRSFLFDLLFFLPRLSTNNVQLKYSRPIRAFFVYMQKIVTVFSGHAQPPATRRQCEIICNIFMWSFGVWSKPYAPKCGGYLCGTNADTKNTELRNSPKCIRVCGTVI